MGNITSTGSRRSGGSNSDVLAAAAGRPQKRIKLTKTNDVNVGSPKYTSISSSNISSSSGNSANKTEDNDGDIELTLPAECYALVLEYLDYQTVLSCALTSRVIIHDAMPLVKTLHIDTALQMNIPLAARFRDVQHINLYSLLKGNPVDEEGEALVLDYNAVMQVIPFLSAFPYLQRIFFGGKKINGEIVTFCYHDGLPWDEERDYEKVHTLIDLVSGSFRSAGGLLNSVQVMGLRCPYSGKVNNNENKSECEVCKRACRSFPLDQVVKFDNEGSYAGSVSLFKCKKTPCLDVCLSRSVIESIAEERSGGKDILRSNARLFYLLGRGSSYEIRSNDGQSLFIVRYGTAAKAELERVIEYAELDTKEMSSEDVTKAMWSSFAKGDGCKVPSKKQCYLSEHSFNFLENYLDLPIDENDFGLEAARVENLPQIAKGVMVDDPVQLDCLNMLGLVLEAPVSEAIQKVIDLGVVPTLVELLSSKDDVAKKQASFIIHQIALKGNDSNAQTLVDEGAVPKLVKLLLSQFSEVAQESVLTLGRLASRSTAIRDIVLHAKALSALLMSERLHTHVRDSSNNVLQTLEYLVLGESPPNLDKYHINMDVLSHRLHYGNNYEQFRFACTALSYICHAPSKHRKRIGANSNLFSPLLNMINVLSPEIQLPALETIRFLLRENSSLIKVMIETGKFPFQCLLSPVVEVRIEACEVVLVLLNGTIEQVDILVAQGCIRALCGCGLLDLDHPVLIITALMSLTKVRICSAHDMPKI